jgi:predicted RNase H-like nuclease (RuvC/YqgF family)
MPGWILIVLVIVFVGSPLAHAIADAIEARASRPKLDPEGADAEHLEHLEERLMLLGEEVHELAEKQEFLTRLLERAPGASRTAEIEGETG